MGEECLHGRLDVDGLVDDAGGLVQDLDAAPPLVLGRQRPVRVVRSRGGNDEQPHRGRRSPQHRDGQDAEAAVRGGDGQAEGERLRQVAELAPAGHEHHRHVDEQDRRRGGDDGGDERSCRRAQGERVTGVEDPREHRHGQGGAEGQVGDVEGQLLDALAAHHGQPDEGADRLADHQLGRGGEEQPEDQRHLAERQRVGL